MRAVVFVSTVENPEESLALLELSLDCVPDNEIVNDFDLIAVEAAVQLKESGDLDEVIVFGMGTELSHLQKCLAMGADSAVIVPCSRAAITAEDVVETAISAFPDKSETIFMLGKLGVNYESHRTAQILSTKLGIPCLNSAYAIHRVKNFWDITCESELGSPVFRVSAPFVMTADLRLASPRFPSLPNIIRSRKKPVLEVSYVQSSLPSVLKTVQLEAAHEGHRQCQMLKDCHELRKHLNL